MRRILASVTTCACLVAAGCDLGAPRANVPISGWELTGADLDGDGDVDLVAGTGDGDPYVRVLENDGAGGFTPTTTPVGPSQDLVLADVEGDGDLDVVVDDFNYRRGSATGLRVWLNEGGAFEASSIVAGPSRATGWNTDMVAGDLHGDGTTDVVITDSFAALYEGSGGGLQPGVELTAGTYAMRAPAIGDVNGDGAGDLVLAGYQEVGAEAFDLLVMTSDGAGGLYDPIFHPTEAASGSGAYSLTLADMNGDGHLDAVTGNGDATPADPRGAVSVALGRGDGTFAAPVRTDVGDVLAVDDVEVGDFDDDGIADVLTAAGDGGSHVLFGDGTGAFPDSHFLQVRDYTAYEAFAADLDGDAVTDASVMGRDLNVFRNALDGARDHP